MIADLPTLKQFVLKVTARIKNVTSGILNPVDTKTPAEE